MRLAWLGIIVLVAVQLPLVAAMARAQDIEDFNTPFVDSDGAIGTTYGLEEEFAHSGKYPGSTHRGWGKTYGFAGGAEMTFLSPNLNGTYPNLTTSDLAAAVPIAYSAGLAEVEEFHPGSRIWLGLQAAEWGLVGRYWRFNNANVYYDPAFDYGAGGALPAVMAENRIDAYSLDFEVTRSWHMATGRTEASLGVRFASLDHDATLSTQSMIGGDLLQGLATSFREYHGTGLTFGWNGYQPFLGSQQFQLFWSTRTSALWGTVRNAVESQAILATPGGLISDASGQFAEDERPMFIGELQLGLQWSRQLTCPATAFVRVTGEYQTWLVNGGDVSASATATDPGIAELSVISAGEGVRANLAGLSLAFGLNW